MKKKKIRKLIGTAKVKEAFAAIETYIKSGSKVDLIHSNLLAQYNSLRVQKIQNLLSFEEYTLASNKITNSLIELLELIDFEVTDEFNVLNGGVDKTIAILGYSGCGKSMYLSALIYEHFERRLDNYLEPIDFTTNTYFHHIIQEILSGDLPTGTSNVNIYDFNLQSRYSRLEKRIIRIVDYKGGDTKFLDNSNFGRMSDLDIGDAEGLRNYVSNSDTIFWLVDLMEYYPPAYYEAGEMVLPVEKLYLNIVSIIQSLLGYRNKAKIDSEPVFSILFMKSDLLFRANISEIDVLDKFSKIINYCDYRFEKFKTFFVSSYGTESYEGFGPPVPISPINVVQSFEWGIK